MIFTSGSTGDPKGVVLSHDNVRANIASIEEAVRLTADDVLVGALPFFHSYGYTATMWTALALDVAGVYHFSPLDAQQIGKLCEKYGVTVLMSTPTFLRNYLRKCTPEQFKKLDVVFGSAEKLPKDLCDAFEEKFGHRPLEAYGATEMSPLISVNVPPSRTPQRDDSAAREGTVGRPIPGVTAKVVDPETGKDLPAGEPGMLWVNGKNVMRGYLNEPEMTAKVVRDGWYVTGDIAFLHPDGFIQITGRQSRFSKIGGEMVPHLKIEEHLLQALKAGEDELPLVVTAVPDEKKGERIVVLHRPLAKSIDELRKALSNDGLPNIWIPSNDSFKEVEKIPVLGTGKLDLKGVKDLAKELFNEEIQ
ncbi:MAG: AMP-binding protein [Pirellulales bacterium]